MSDDRIVVERERRRATAMYSLRSEKWGFLSYSPETEFGYHSRSPSIMVPPTGSMITIEGRPPEPEVLPEGQTPLSGPLMVGFMITKRCNLRCRYCFAKPSAEDSACDGEETAVKVASRIAVLQPLAVWISGGEPTLHRNLAAIVETFATLGVPISLDTNGTRITREIIALLSTLKMGSVRVSLDSLDPVIQNSTRGLAKETLLGVRKLLDAGIIPIVYTVVTRLNVNGLRELHEGLANLGIRKWFVFDLVRAGWAVDVYNDLAVSVHPFQMLKERNEIMGNPISIVFASGNKPRSMVLVDNQGHMWTVDGASKLTSGSLLEVDPAATWQKLPLDRRAHLEKYLHLSRG